MSLPLELGTYQLDQTMGNLERQLICPICLEVFTKPVVILPCQHNLCRKCANDLFQPSLFQARGTMVGAGGRFRCPSCRQEVVLDRHGVYGLQRNLLVENIIDLYKQESASSRPPQKATGQLTCEEHEDEKVNIYCISCQVPTCSLCKVFGAHKSCQVAPLSEVYQQQKAELTEGVGSLVAANDHVQEFIGEMEEICKNIEENCKEQKQSLCEKFDRMYNILEERRKIMLQRITYEQEEKTVRARALVQVYGERVETNSKLVSTALQTMEEPQMAAFLQSARSLIEQVVEATKTSIIEPLEPGFDNLGLYTVDFNEEERALYQLDFMKIEEEISEELKPESEKESMQEPEIELKENPLGPKAEEIEEVRGQAEGSADPKKEPPYVPEGLNTQQVVPELWHEEHDAGDLEIQGLLAEASEDTQLYPGWYKANTWQVLGPSLAAGSKPPEESEVHSPPLYPHSGTDGQNMQGQHDQDSGSKASEIKSAEQPGEGPCVFTCISMFNVKCICLRCVFETPSRSPSSWLSLLVLLLCPHCLHFYIGCLPAVLLHRFADHLSTSLDSHSMCHMCIVCLDERSQ